jgi:hypothetical protein
MPRLNKTMILRQPPRYMAKYCRYKNRTHPLINRMRLLIVPVPRGMPPSLASLPTPRTPRRPTPRSLARLLLAPHDPPALRHHVRVEYVRAYGESVLGRQRGARLAEKDDGFTGRPGTTSLRRDSLTGHVDGQHRIQCVSKQRVGRRSVRNRPVHQPRLRPNSERVQHEEEIVPAAISFPPCNRAKELTAARPRRRAPAPRARAQSTSISRPR